MDSANECWTSEYNFEGPGKTQNGHQFVVCATLDAGAIEYFSGIHLIIYCNDETEELSDLVSLRRNFSFLLSF